MEEAIRKADVLIEALPYIQSFRDRVVVVKLGGSSIDLEGRALDAILQDLIFMEAVGMETILVHGGGQYISRKMKEQGVNPEFVNGLRVTGGATLDIVIEVMVDQVNHAIIHRIEKLGGGAVSVEPRKRPYIYAEKRPQEHDVDLGMVGRVTGVNDDALRQLCKSGVIPVIASLGSDTEGKQYNVNADEVAAAVARSLQAEKAIFLSDVAGILRDKNDPSSLISTLTHDAARELIRSGSISEGMIPKVQSCISLLDSGVKKAHIVDGGLSHSLLLEIFTTKGVGTQILRNASP